MCAGMEVRMEVRMVGGSKTGNGGNSSNRGKGGNGGLGGI